MPTHGDMKDDWEKKAEFWKGLIFGICLTVLTAYLLVGAID